MDGDADVSVPAHALGDPARGRIAVALLGGDAVPAGRLARLVGLAPSTTSGHLRVLEAAGLVTVEAHGRTRRYRLADGDVARAVEALQAIAPSASVTSLRRHRDASRLREARTCYDHLAGDLGLRLTDLLVRHEILTDPAVGVALPAPDPFPAGAVVDLLGLEPPTGRRPWARGCLDWTGRRPHVAGQLGAQVLRTLTSHGWIAPEPESRVVRLTDAGRRGLADLEAVG